jgi:hypothetical protein
MTLSKREMRERQLSNLSDVFSRVRDRLAEFPEMGKTLDLEIYAWTRRPSEHGLRSGFRLLKKAKQFLKGCSRDLDQAQRAISEVLDELGEWV